ncbi:LCP family protein [Subtercola frigoramans]|uniref:LCP family protein required for cell wall assembly n=1 Tax=Subtercola frigoramans TaxID=120298 RepID=A0ABS2L5V8_9MICO|nr:LCP family protein [Subtercola frigoramans]MBM7472428.1 LCP family protein required for cell wall assembly [Subtercola frigoramans]
MTTVTPPHQQPHQHRPLTPEQRRRRRRRQVTTRWIVIVVVLAVVVTGGYVAYNYQRFVNGITHIDGIGSNGGSGKDQNILLVGDDHRPDNATPEQLAALGTEQDGGGTSTDTMIVVHLPADGSSATMISLPRDSWVDIPDNGKGKLNSAFVLGTENGGGDAGGAKLLISTIQNLTGLTIDHFVRVSLLGFYNVVDALGPVQVCLNEAVNDPFSAINLPAGVSELNASQALSFVRQRHGLPRGDLDREVRQQYFLSVEARQILSAGTLLNPGKLASVLDAISSSIETDSGLNIIDLAAQMRNLNADKISSATIPITGTPTITVDGSDVSIVEVDTAAMPAFIQGIVNPGGSGSSGSASSSPSAYDSATASNVGDVTVTVLNASDSDGVAASNTDALGGFGFKTGTPDSAATRATTTIQYAPGKEADAKALAAYVPGAALEESSDATDVTLILGTDGLAVVDPSAAAPAANDAPASTPDSSAPATEAPTTSYASGSCIN